MYKGLKLFLNLFRKIKKIRIIDEILAIICRKVETKHPKLLQVKYNCHIKLWLQLFVYLIKVGESPQIRRTVEERKKT